MMRCYSNEIYPVKLVVSDDTASVNECYYNAVEGEEANIHVKPSAEGTAMFLTGRSDDSMAVGIIFSRKPGVKLMTHEAFHAAVMMLDVGVHIPLNEHTEEAYAFCIGWIAECIDDFVKDTFWGLRKEGQHD